MNNRSALLVASFLFLFSSSAWAAPMRVVTLAPNLAEWVSEIIGREETLKRLVGVSEYSEYPSYVTRIRNIGPYPRVHVEKILTLKPDLILALAESNDEEQLKQLERLKLKVVRLPQERLSNMSDWITKLGTALGETTLANAAAARWKGQIQRINLKAAKIKNLNRRVFLEVQDEPLVTVGGPSFLGDAFKLIGYSNVFSNLTQAYPKVSRESVLTANPEYIFIMDLHGSETHFDKARNQWRKFKDLTAVKNDQIRFLKGDDYGRCSFRLLYALEKWI